MRLLALDFDGVISDSAPEAFWVALRTWCELHPRSPFLERVKALGAAGLDAAPAAEAVRGDPLYAPFLEMMPLGNRAEDYAVELEALERGVELADQQAYDRFKRSIDAGALRAFHRRFYEIRTALRRTDPPGWLALMRSYPGIPELLRRRAGQVLLAIATSKDRGSVGHLLAAYGIADLFPEGRVLDKEVGVSKRAHLEHLERVFAVPFEEMTFVDDKVNHLEAVADLGVRCALAAWGYNGPREVALAGERGYGVLELADAEAVLFPAGHS